MKIKVLLLVAFISIAAVKSEAQHVRVRLNFPVSISINAPGRAPFYGAVWIAPEWRWRHGRYVAVPGYWARPHHHRTAWRPGYWKYTRRGYIWIPGRWR